LIGAGATGALTLTLRTATTVTATVATRGAVTAGIATAIAAIATIWARATVTTGGGIATRLLGTGLGGGALLRCGSCGTRGAFGGGATGATACATIAAAIGCTTGAARATVSTRATLFACPTRAGTPLATWAAGTTRATAIAVVTALGCLGRLFSVHAGLGQLGFQLGGIEPLAGQKFFWGQLGLAVLTQQLGALAAGSLFGFFAGLALGAAAGQLFGGHLAVFFRQLACRLAIEVKALRALADGDQVGRGTRVAAQESGQGLFGEHARGTFLDVGLHTQLERLGRALEQGGEALGELGTRHGRVDSGAGCGGARRGVGGIGSVGCSGSGGRGGGIRRGDGGRLLGRRGQGRILGQRGHGVVQ
jgi:hypothetical protein